MTIQVTFNSFNEMLSFAKKMNMLQDDQPDVMLQPYIEVSGNATPEKIKELVKDTLDQAMQSEPAQVETVSSVVPTQDPPKTQQVETSAPDYSLDDLAHAAITLMDAGRQDELQQLLANFGVQSLPELPQDQYGAFATALREMGAQI